MKVSVSDIPARNSSVLAWVNEMASLCGPDKIYWCDGPEEEKGRITQESLASGELEELNQANWPGCYYSRSDLNDVARTEKLTFICSRVEEDAGITNN